MSLLFVVLTQDVKKLKIQVGGYTTDTISPPRYKFGSPGADHRMYYLDQPRCRPISKKLSYLINRFRNNVYRREALPTFDLRKPTFSAPLARSLWWDPPPPTPWRDHHQNARRSVRDKPPSLRKISTNCVQQFRGR